MLSDREQKIVEYMVQVNPDVKTKELAFYFNVSERTIRNDFSKIKLWASRNGFDLYRLKGGWSFDAQSIGGIKSVYGKSEFTHTPLVRQLHMTFYLLCQNDRVSVQDLCNEFFVSRGTVLYDLKAIERWLSKHNVNIKSSSNGYEIVGHEVNVRIAIISVLKWLEYEWHVIDVYKEMQWTHVTYSDIHKIEHILNVNLADIDVNESSIGLWAMIYIVVLERLRDDQAMLELNIQLSVPNYIHILSDHFHQEFELNGTDFEKTWVLTALILFGEEKNLLIEHEENWDRFDSFINSIFLKMGIINPSKATIVQIRHELSKVDLICDYSLNKYSPIHKEMVSEYSYLYEYIIQEWYHLNINQKVHKYLLTDLAMLFASELESYYSKFHYFRVAVVCLNGVATSYLLSSRLKKMFTNIEIVGVFSPETLYNVQPYLNFDLIVSTVNLPKSTKPLITVKPFLDQAEIAKIEQFIQGHKQSSNISLIDGDYRRLFSENQVKVAKVNSLTEGFKEGVSVLERNGSVDHLFLNHIIEVYEKHGAYFEVIPGLLMPHAISNDVSQVDFSFLCLEDPIVTNERTFHAILTLCSPDSHLHLPFLQQLHHVLMQVDNAEDLINKVLEKGGSM